MSTRLGRSQQRFSDPLLTVLTLTLSILLFGIGPMQASGIITGQHFGSSSVWCSYPLPFCIRAISL
jgi:hypothetical protein